MLALLHTASLSFAWTTAIMTQYFFLRFDAGNPSSF